MAEFVRLEIAGGIGTIRLDRPPMNALNTQVQEELRAAASAAAASPEVRAVIVYGGEKVFAAGADIKEMADMSYVDMATQTNALSSAFDARRGQSWWRPCSRLRTAAVDSAGGSPGNRERAGRVSQRERLDWNRPRAAPVRRPPVPAIAECRRRAHAACCWNASRPL